MEDLDRKFTFIATKTKDGTTVTQEEGIIFLAKDNLLLPTLKHYYSLCENSEIGIEQLTGVKLLIRRVEAWRKSNPDKCKNPDVDWVEAEQVCKENK